MGIHNMGPGRNLEQPAFVLMFDGVPNVSKLAVFKDEEAVFFSQRLQFVADGRCKVLAAGDPTHQLSDDDNHSKLKKALTHL